MMGYMANPDLGDAHVKEIIGKNFAAIDNDGWLRSGDKGVKDDCGIIKITGRYKELIIGAGGENVAPIPVEDALKAACPAISEVLMVGNMRPYCVALITLVAEGANNEVPGTDNLDGPALALGATFDVKTISGAVKSEGFMNAISQKIDEVNKNERAVPKPPAEIKRFTILPSNFSVQNEEFTPTFKLKRAYVENKFKDVVSQLYDKDIQFGMFVPTEASM
jgi:long-chain-fatty-acid--CoA ligase ACSBG